MFMSTHFEADAHCVSLTSGDQRFASEPEESQTTESNLEYGIDRDHDKFVAIDSDEETVGVYDSEEEAQVEIAREKRKKAMWERTEELIRAAVKTIVAEFSEDLETALAHVNSAAGMTIFGVEESRIVNGEFAGHQASA
jgi:hypothetical protein